MMDGIWERRSWAAKMFGPTSWAHGTDGTGRAVWGGRPRLTNVPVCGTSLTPNDPIDGWIGGRGLTFHFVTAGIGVAYGPGLRRILVGRAILARRRSILSRPQAIAAED